ncbi:HYC_CC_PP family protein [Pedobacter caeni]|uniref:Uncharacterized protein n=1 Tax=Pedobacter caeni TaxID=288992 RepID=A0A1M5LEI2_9SPHI|nr:hypothetical protein [Pedobacter caeni]SHG63471.1 hypothetical protein SAMN04488522_106316 [Pedobacter caeni]
MKRTLLTILAVFYLGVSSGATLHFHYCMGELVSWGLDQQDKEICGFCGMPKGTPKAKAKSCCEDEKQQPKVDKSQKANVPVYEFNAASSAVILPSLFVNYKLEIPVKITREALSNAPPDGNKIPVFLKNCTYRI